jgi:TolB-like protein/tetratricopeptide (TPR) repeat protein
MSEQAAEPQDTLPATIAPAPTPTTTGGSASNHGHRPHIEFKLLDELKKRNIVRVGILYLVACWLILEPTHVVFHMLEIPLWANRLVLILMAIGFPAVLLFSWVYELTPGGLKPTVEVGTHKSIRPLTGRRLDRAIVVVLALAVAYFVADKFWFRSAPIAEPDAIALAAPAAPAPAAPPAFSPPAHSVAVLPFVNMSGDPKQEYFSDGLSEELLNSLARIRELLVAARTSSFSFKGKGADVADIARKLNVGAVLEGSVRKDGTQVRITVQLINAVSGFHVWSQTYDRNLRDILALQTEVATAVTQALQVTLLEDTSALVELGGTHNPIAFDAYLRARNLERTATTGKDNSLARIAAYGEAIRLDPHFAEAYVGRSVSETDFADYYATEADIREHFKRARAAAEKALALAPDLGEAHAAYARVLHQGFLDFAHALAEYDHALALSPNDSSVLLLSGWFFADLGRAEVGVTNTRRGIALDQLNPWAHLFLGYALWDARRYRESIEAYNRVLSLDKEFSGPAGSRGLSYLLLGELESARESCAPPPHDFEKHLCLAIVYDKLQRRPDAQAELNAMKADTGDSSAYQYAEIYAQWGEVPKALEWLETAYRLQDPGFSGLKVDALLDPLRNEPRFREIERKLRIPS